MKPTELLKVAAIAMLTSGFIVGCQQTTTTDMDTDMAEEECEGATPEVRNAIYAAKLKNARARNLGGEWEEAAKIIEEAEAAAENCEHVRAKILANKAEDMASDAIAALDTGEPMAEAPAQDDSPYLGGYLVVAGDNLWSISGQQTIYGDPFMWPLIYKANSGQIKDADLIYPGQYFYIPKAKGPERAAAINHAKTRGAWSIGVTEASDLEYLAQ